MLLYVVAAPSALAAPRRPLGKSLETLGFLETSLEPLLEPAVASHVTFTRHKLGAAARIASVPSTNLARTAYSRDASAPAS